MKTQWKSNTWKKAAWKSANWKTNMWKSTNWKSATSVKKGTGTYTLSVHSV